MDVNTFYELRTRLYATAATGCGLINEDFRLKRALEAFEPMSKANKVFERLYQMCEKLFNGENPAGGLADCIGLADALAVTQGSFLDKSECVEEENKLCLKPQTVSNKSLKAVQKTLLEERITDQDNIEKDMHLFLEPRLFPSFIQSLKRENVILDGIAKELLPQLGDPLIPILKEQIDFQATGVKNKTACYVKWIARLYGEKETNWYIEVAENTDYPSSIRSAAVWALGRSEKNTPKLLELYKTQKGIVKDAVIYELARWDPPEAEEVWKKLTEKCKDKYIDFIAWSKSDICAGFVRKKFYEIVEQYMEDYKKGKKKEHWSLANENRGLEWIKKTICRKYQLEDCFRLFAEKYEYIEKIAPNPYSRGGSWREEMNQVLIGNLIEEDIRYSEMIKNLYSEHKEFYFPARFFLALKETGEQAFEDYWIEMHKERKLTLQILQSMIYNFGEKGYFISWDCITFLYGIGKEHEGKLKIFDTFPNRLISFASETDYLMEKGDLSNNRDKEYIINKAFNILDPLSIRVCEGMTDYERCREAVVKFALEINQQYSIGREIDVLEALYNGKPEEYIGFVTNYVMQNVFECHDTIYQPYYIINKMGSLPMKDEDRKKGLLELKKKVEALETTTFEKSLQGKYEKEKKEVLSKINKVIEQYGWQV